MFGSLGAPELILIFLVALLLFGPRRLPDLGRTIGRSLGEFRRATRDLKSSLEREVTESETAGAARPAEDPARGEIGGPSRDPMARRGEGGGPE